MQENEDSVHFLLELIYYIIFNVYNQVYNIQGNKDYPTEHDWDDDNPGGAARGGPGEQTQPVRGVPGEGPQGGHQLPPGPQGTVAWEISRSETHLLKDRYLLHGLNKQG